MKLTDEGRFNYEGGTRLYMRLWEDENKIDKPVVFVEVERDYSVASNRMNLARDVAKSLGTTPDNIRWYEQSPNGNIKEYEFQPFQAQSRAYANDESLQDYTKAEKAGERQPERHTHYMPKEKALAPEEKTKLQAEVKDRLESFEQKQNREFEEMNYRFLGKSI